ncbi:hypothetical protein RN001_005563 [Aquatica leii]|uniref:Uncharacterized protein n=1 Tax=Aquatica leii TaxID=1421715 RepID=A0AAN7Q0I3_9COLE|nr:hypothetical protein RN001_005563 [Aquatica leii]
MSKYQLFQLCKTKFCRNRDENPLSIATFLKEFDNKRLSLYRSKKDLCDICHNFFKKCDKIKHFNSIRPGKSSGSPVVNDLKALKYSSNNGVFYKLRHVHDWQLLPMRLNVSKVVPINFKNLPQLHKNSLKIKTEKNI